MGYSTTNTLRRVQLRRLQLNQAQTAYCAELRAEAGRAWTAIVEAHVASRSGAWLTEAELKAQFKGQFALHSQTVQALVEKLLANVATAHELRTQQAAAGLPITAHYPYRPKPYQTVTWKMSAIRIRDGALILSNGAGRPPLHLPLTPQDASLPIRQVELLWRPTSMSLR